MIFLFFYIFYTFYTPKLVPIARRRRDLPGSMVKSQKYWMATPFKHVFMTLRFQRNCRKTLNIKNQTFILDLRQTATTKMTAMTVGSFHVFVQKGDFALKFTNQIRFVWLYPNFHFSLIIDQFFSFFFLKSTPRVALRCRRRFLFLRETHFPF